MRVLSNFLAVRRSRVVRVVLVGLAVAGIVATVRSEAPPGLPSFHELKSRGAAVSRYRSVSFEESEPGVAELKPNLDRFQQHIAPVLRASCGDCHGPDTQEGNIRIDTLDPNLFVGEHLSWWLEVLAVLAKSEMPPPGEAPMADDDRSKVVEWLTNELQRASRARRATAGHTSFRRLTRYEYNYALQDLLGLPFDFSKALPPESQSEDGFENSSEMLHMSATHVQAYRESARKALELATVRGDKPRPIYWITSMADASGEIWAEQDEERRKLVQQHQDDPDKLGQALEQYDGRLQKPPGGTYYKDLGTGRHGRVRWSYGGAKYAWTPRDTLPEAPETVSHVAVIPPRGHLIVELGDRIPDRGTMRVRARAARVFTEQRMPSLQLEFGWQASNDSAASVRVSQQDVLMDAAPGSPRWYQWEIPLSQVYPRNSVRGISHMGDLPSPSEFLKLVNSSDSEGDVQIEYVEITASVYDQWPPESHQRILPDREPGQDDSAHARQVLSRFMSRAWRRPVSDAELDQKLQLFEQLRPSCEDFQEAMTEVMTTVLSSPHFLYLSRESSDDASPDRSDYPLATRLSMFLWSSSPDDELLDVASRGELRETEELAKQVQRMLADRRAERFAKHFVRQWLGMHLLDYLDVDRKVYPQFDASLQEAMQAEPIWFFQSLLRNDGSVLDFIHSDYTFANERLARHYGLPGVFGNEIRRVNLDGVSHRGGVLTQSGLLAMNSDGKDSHPLKRGIWLLESLLNDPPPPPPPAVPAIDLADPEIAKLTLKQRMEDHRNDPACYSCHAKIDPWGIAMEDFDAVGRFRTELQGKPVDSTSQLFNGQTLEGIDGLKRYLLSSRQDQFVRAMVYKLTTYALGRPLTFADRASIEEITADVRRQGDGLATMVGAIVASDLFLECP